jgi:predicted RNA binding protein YcfA (HicA-like mRNA interferase family)
MSPKLPRVDCQKLIRALKRAGFEEQRQRGSHLHLRRSHDGKRVTVPVHKGKTVPTGTLRAILRDADISVEEFENLLKKHQKG